MGNTPSSTAADGPEGDGPEGDQPIDLSRLPEELTSKYEVVSKIGSGSFGSVYKVRNKKTKVTYAAKNVEAKEDTTSEVIIQAKIDDEHVVKIFDTIRVPSNGQMVIVMEYCEGGNLLEWIKRNRRHQLLNERIIMKMFRDICWAVYNCHQMKIIHRDLKPENILLDGRRRIKLADFGVARVLHRESVAKSFCGTPPYMAPELFLSYMARGSHTPSNVGYDDKCDVWSIGCILWDMANSANLFVFELSNNPGLNLAKASPSIGAKEIQDLIDKDIPDDYLLTKRMLRGMLVNDPDQRLSLSTILQDTELRKMLENPSSGHWSDIM